MSPGSIPSQGVEDAGEVSPLLPSSPEGSSPSQAVGVLSPAVVKVRGGLRPIWELSVERLDPLAQSGRELDV